MVVVQCLSEFSVWMCKCLLLLIHLPCSGWFWFKMGDTENSARGRDSLLLPPCITTVVFSMLISFCLLRSLYTADAIFAHNTLSCDSCHTCGASQITSATFLCSVHQLFQWICCPTEYKTCYTWYLYLSVFLMLSRVCFWDWIFSGVF